jgi:hypothetical protein
MILFLTILTAATDRLRAERGQSSVEYLGIVVVAATLVLVLIGAANGWGSSITAAIGQRISSIAGG